MVTTGKFWINRSGCTARLGDPLTSFCPVLEQDEACRKWAVRQSRRAGCVIGAQAPSLKKKTRLIGKSLFALSANPCGSPVRARETDTRPNQTLSGSGSSNIIDIDYLNQYDVRAVLSAP